MEKIIKFKGLCCANCAAKLEKKLNKIKGLKAMMSFVAGKILFEYSNEDVFEEAILLCKKEYPDMEIFL
ncbi:MAG: cation transporter [Anaeroplasma sp.]